MARALADVFDPVIDDAKRGAGIAYTDHPLWPEVVRRSAVALDAIEANGGYPNPEDARNAWRFEL